MTVFRPRRRCPQCGLVNSNSAKKCRRCGRSLADIDPALQSELMVMRIRAGRFAAVAIVVLLIGGVIAAAYFYQAKLARLAAFTERARTMETDIVTLKRGAAEDASAIAKAFDDREVKALLRDQSATWAKRVDQCKALGTQLDELVPQNDEQTAQELTLQRDVARIQATAQALADAAQSGDIFASRVAAANLADAGAASK